ncbi:MAG: sulfurtransferase, partial [Saprospiraceae bacterium]|nr:sulfurtransferase [Saprospiraceae bacterium]
MKNIKLILSSLVVLFFLGSVAMAQPEVITAEMFKSMVEEDVEMVLLDANKKKGYKAAHLENAIFINHNDLYKEGEIKGLIKSPEELATIFGELGVGDDVMVVVTDDGSQKYSSRVSWILSYLGYDNVKILHKDKKQWRDSRLSLTSKVVNPTPRNFMVKLRPEIMATMEDVALVSENPNLVLVDARTPEEFEGNHKNSDGHIPGAINMNYEDLLTDTGAFKSKDDLMAMMEEKGFTPEKEYIFYCRTSVRAGVPYYAFKYILGYNNVK